MNLVKDDWVEVGIHDKLKKKYKVRLMDYPFIFDNYRIFTGQETNGSARVYLVRHVVRHLTEEEKCQLLLEM